MSLTAIAAEKRAFTYFAASLLSVAGIASFFNLGQLEDPEFTVKTAAITTLYPGASPAEVELEVTDRIELAIQEMPQIDFLESLSRAGFSLIKVNIKPEFWSDRLPQVWDEWRRISAEGPYNSLGISYERLRARRGLQWPCPDEDHPGTARRHRTKFSGFARWPIRRAGRWSRNS